MSQEPRLDLPTTIELKDGRKFSVAALLAQRTRAVNHNLRAPKTLKIRVPQGLQGLRSRKAIKYSIEDRIWLALATVAEIQQRYTINERQAFYMKYQSRYIVEQLDLLDK